MTVLFILLAAMTAGDDAPLALGPAEIVAEGFQFTEGPAWLPGEGLVFSDIPADTIYRPDKTEFRKPSGKSNGLGVDMEGRLIACEHWNRRVTRTEKDGAITVLAGEYLGRKLNSPNDLTVRSDGAIFFTDPPYGLEKREAELPFSGVYAIMPDGTLRLLSVYFSRPNGIVLSPDEKTLYIADSEDNFIQAFDVAEDGALSNSRLFCEAPLPDGMAMDELGRVWTTAFDGIRVYDPDGRHSGTITIPMKPANCAFGGEDFSTLYVTGLTTLFKVPAAVGGFRPAK